MTRSALQDQERDYQAFGNSIAQAVNSQLRGLLTGTTTWHTAFKNTLDDLLIKFIEWCETSVARYVLAKSMKTAATTAGVAARTGAEQGGAAASLGAQARQWSNPFFPPLRKHSLACSDFLRRSWVPSRSAPPRRPKPRSREWPALLHPRISACGRCRDQLALIHQNELIMPAGPAGALRDMLTSAPNGGSAGGGGSVAIHPTTHLHVNAIDGPSVASWMRQNGPGMAKALDQAVRHGAALGLKRLNGR